MKYYEINMRIEPCTQDAQDLLAALTAEAGMETFEETESGLKGYAQQQLLDEEALREAIATFPISGVSISYTIEQAEDRDWNEQWEQEGFEPIVVRWKMDDGRWKMDDGRWKMDERVLVIHDGRHLPSAICHQPSAIMIEIDAHMAFGTGTHETTRMICRMLMGMDLKGRRVLDCGSGTGILGICALKLGADSCTAYDIDEWSTDNTRHNAVINHVDDRLEALCGDATLLDGIDGQFDVVMANINRNILLQDMPRFAAKMKPGAMLIMSGFYQQDVPMLTEKAESLGLTTVATVNDGEWTCVLSVLTSQF
jgi:ribosomal protein L11 methyltransferase